MSEQAAATTTNDELVIKRVFDAPRELVFQAWTDPEHFAQWFGPNGFTTPHCSLDVRIGGKLHFCMRSEQIGDTWSAGIYQVIDPPSRLVFSLYFSDEHGNKVPPSGYEIDESFPDESTVSLTFEEPRVGRTKMTMRHRIPASMAGEAGEGWNQSFEKLAAYLVTGGG